MLFLYKYQVWYKYKLIQWKLSSMKHTQPSELEITEHAGITRVTCIHWENSESKLSVANVLPKD